MRVRPTNATSSIHLVLAIVGTWALAGCSDSNPDVTSAVDAGVDVPATHDVPAVPDVPNAVDVGTPTDVPAAVDARPNDPAQTPPTTGRVDLEAWIAAGHYRSWHCEPAPHASRPPSPHGSDRICSNDLLSASTAGTFPVGSAAVKELFATPGNPTGYAVYVKLTDGTDGASWYWYERIGTRQVADGSGASGTARSICVGCHSSAPRDFVFTQVR